jgi:hypothetical protein
MTPMRTCLQGYLASLSGVAMGNDFRLGGHQGSRWASVTSALAKVTSQWSKEMHAKVIMKHWAQDRFCAVLPQPWGSRGQVSDSLGTIEEGFFVCGTGIWTQSLPLARLVLPLEPLSQPLKGPRVGLKGQLEFVKWWRRKDILGRGTVWT